MPRAPIGTPLAPGPMPPNMCQYGPAAYHSRVVTFLLHIFGGFQKCLNNKNKLKLKRGIVNAVLIKVLVYIFSLGS